MKKRTAVQPAQLALADAAYSGIPHHNQRLFSDYFLKNLLRHEPPWKEHWEALKKEAKPLKEQMQDLFKKFAPSITTNEAQTEREWIQPVLTLLGHAFEVQAELRVPGKTQKPDYVFYADEATRLANRGRILDDTVVQQGAFAVGDAKRWLRPLDLALKGAQRSGDTDNNKNPSFQIFFYMLHTKCPWGILTNGKQWRLYHENTAHKLEIFYEVDLPDLLLDDEIDSFLYFFAFFRRAAFDPGPLALDRLLSASTEYAQQISDNLRKQVYGALCDIVQGFLDYPQNKLIPSDETCRLLYGSSLVLLYRLLFVFYAEARGLLPVDENKQYKSKYSLEAIKNSVAAELQEGKYVEVSGNIWQRLKTLFAVVERGSKVLQVTAFNGGLFTADTDEFHQFLDQYTIGDAGICKAIDKLARTNGQYIDYRDLSERHLGTIYEGLLEYTLHVASEPMVELRSSGKIVPIDEAPKRDIARTYETDQAYLVTDREERKTTGSYYTPDYIVKYMVEQTISPMLDEAIAALGEAATDEEKIRTILAFKVLDPAMGSGHFLVEVVEFLARYIVELDLQTDETNVATLAYWKRRVVQQCIYGTDLNPLSVELAKLSLWLATAAKDHPLNFLDHHLRSGNAVVGCWFDEILGEQRRNTKKKEGKRSLLSVYGQEQTEETGQGVPVPLLDIQALQQDIVSAAELFQDLEDNPGDTVEEVRKQKQAFEEMEKVFKRKYLALAHLKSALFYMDISDDLWRPLAQYLLGKEVQGGAIVEKKLAEIIDEALAIATDRKHFLHWEIEFPYVFYDHRTGRFLGEKAGFDVIVGNPPYVRQEQLWEDKPFLEDHYGAFQGTADLFVYFFQQALRLLRKGGKLTFISSNTWLRTNSATKLRQYLRTQAKVETLIDLGNNRIFADAPDLSPAIQIIKKDQSSAQSHIAMVASFARGERVQSFISLSEKPLFALPIHDQPDEGWQLTNEQSRRLLNRLLAQGTPLKDFTGGKMYRGVVTGSNEVFVINHATYCQLIAEDSSSTTLLKPVFRGEDLRTWYQEDEGRWLIFTSRGVDIDSYPAIKRYLQQFREKLEPRPRDWDNQESWPGRKPGPYKWYEIQDTVEYAKEFDRTKIFYPDITRRPRFSWGAPNSYTTNTGYFIPTDSYELLGILNSRVLWFVLTHFSQPLGERKGTLIYRLFSQFMERLPIPSLTKEQSTSFSDLTQQLMEVAQQRYQVRRKWTQRIINDLGSSQTKPTERLEEWWNLPWPDFREEVRKSFKKEIPVRERGDWEALLQENTLEIRDLTAKIVQMEQALNAIIYGIFGLDHEEIMLIEQEAKYQYGEW